MPLFFLLLLLLLPAHPGHADNPLSFADSLAAEGDHYRAITEYKRFLHYHPDAVEAARAQLAIAHSLRAGERWTELDLALEKVWKSYPGTPEAASARKLYADAAFARQDYPEARQRYQWLQENAQNPGAAGHRIGWSFLAENRIAEARQSFGQSAEETANDWQRELDDYQQLPRKAPQLAGTLSAILPGAGQLYTERPRQAAVAFALNAAFIYGAIEAWNNENYAVAGILSLFEIGWYGGNIVNAVNNAHKYNRNQEELFKQRLRQKFGLSLGWREQAPQLQAHFRF